ncbi:hypothetical protein F441_02086 [Phytophthora nicotianae CJ01A1]|uniref:RxLR effector protein n=2 Tax=Phytophthora nicotianae TaxID=4792 RepID=W2XSX2_PHYNI|nr:hypothetical protein L915_21587 [Phytophthora nicotianae]ETP25039.1 hypothetical protein F441_02086 [Phytophthora nicotianae CJ01A1]
MRSPPIVIVAYLVFLAGSLFSAAHPSSISAIIPDQTRSLPDNTNTADKESSAERGAWQWVKVRLWLELGMSDGYVRKALKLDSFDDAALKAHKNYKYYEFFYKKALAFRLFRMLKTEATTFDVWKWLGFSHIKAGNLKQIVGTTEFEAYERYVTTFYRKVQNEVDSLMPIWYPIPSVRASLDATEAEKTARTLIRAKLDMREDIATILLGMTEPGKWNVPLKNDALLQHKDYKYLKLFRNRHQKPLKWEEVNNIV